MAADKWPPLGLSQSAIGRWNVDHVMAAGSVNPHMKSACYLRENAIVFGQLFLPDSFERPLPSNDWYRYHAFVPGRQS